MKVRKAICTVLILLTGAYISLYIKFHIRNNRGVGSKFGGLGHDFSSGQSRSAVILNTCTGRASICSLNRSYAYIFYIANGDGMVRSSSGKGTEVGSTSSYHDYAKRAITRTAALTRFDILVLCTKQYFARCRDLLSSIPTFLSQITLTSIDENIWLAPFHKFGVKQKRPKLMHAYGTTQVFNPLYTKKYDRIIYMDLDTFLIRNIDELFCTYGFAVAHRRGVQLFNGGVFAYSPSERTYEAIMSYMLQYMKRSGEKKFAMQAILHEIFGQEYFCVASVYNCGGFCSKSEGCSQISPKCGLHTEEDIFLKGAVIHSKIGEEHMRSIYPILHELWLSYG